MAQGCTVPVVRERKVARGGDPLVMLTAYDAPGARMVDQAGADMILVGDSVAMVVLGYDDTLQVTVEDIAHHTAAVARTHPSALVIADMPWMSYHVSTADTVKNAATLIRAGAQAVKLEGGRRRIPMIEALVSAEIPVMGHIGLTPQSMNAMGGYRVQGRDAEAALGLVDAAKALAHAGCFSIVLEGVPAPVATMVTEAVEVSTIGIGAGLPRRPGAGLPRRPGPGAADNAEVRQALRRPLRPRRGRSHGVRRRRQVRRVSRTGRVLPARRRGGRRPGSVWSRLSSSGTTMDRFRVPRASPRGDCHTRWSCCGHGCVSDLGMHAGSLWLLA